MLFIKKNIWFLFFVILSIGTIFISLVIYENFNSLKDRFSTKHENITKLMANTTTSFFMQYEMILDILGDQMTINENYKDEVKSKTILTSLLELNPNIAGLGLALPDGKLVRVSSNLDVSKLPNLLEKKETKDSFKKALNSSKMVIGRTYYFDLLKAENIPIRKAIRDEIGDIIAVMTAGIEIDNSIKLFFEKNMLNDDNHNFLIFRNFDNYVQYIISKDLKRDDIYLKPIDSKTISIVKKEIEKKYSMSIESIGELEKTVSIFIFNSNDEEVLLTAQYIKRYDLWIVSKDSLDEIYITFYKNSIIYTTIFLLIMLFLFALFKYISDSEEEHKKSLYYQASHDSLTTLPNRQFLLDIKRDWIFKGAKPFSFFFIDMDNFKHINDSYGHDFGDRVLRDIARRLKNIISKDDLAIRQGGDEFIIMTPTVSKREVMHLAQRVLDSLSEPYLIEEYNFILCSSIGISKYPKDGSSLTDLIKSADVAMYEAKKQRNNFCIFKDSIKNRYFRRVQIEYELKFALANEEFYLVYQPQIDNKGSIYGVETLVRWENRKLGFVPPDEFIKIAEDTGVMPSIGKFILKTALSDMYELQNRLQKEFQISINISVKQFMEIGFLENLKNLIEEIGNKKELITLEITETLFIEDLDYILTLLERVKEMGLKISLDDFGTGYSSLSLLKKLPIDELKIDKSFVDDIESSKRSKEMLQSVITIGKNLNYTVLAEGIENIEQVKLLTDFKCEVFQGYYFSKPIRKEELAKHLVAL